MRLIQRIRQMWLFWKWVIFGAMVITIVGLHACKTGADNLMPTDGGVVMTSQTCLGQLGKSITADPLETVAGVWPLVEAALHLDWLTAMNELLKLARGYGVPFIDCLVDATRKRYETAVAVVTPQSDGGQPMVAGSVKGGHLPTATGTVNQSIDPVLAKKEAAKVIDNASRWMTNADKMMVR